MSFSTLLIEVEVKILKMENFENLKLKCGDKYLYTFTFVQYRQKICPHTLYQHENSLLQDWTEFVRETWRSVPEVGEFASISKSLTNSDGYFVIDSLDVLEAAWVLVSIGHIETIEKLVIKSVDMKNIPINIINSLNKIFRSSLEFY